MIEEDLDVLLLTETWQTNYDDVALCRCVPPVYTHMEVPRLSRVHGSRQNHGGVATDVHCSRPLLECFTCRIHALLRTYNESFCLSVIGAGRNVVNLVILHRPGSAPTATPSSLNLRPNSSFCMVPHKCQVVVAGYFNMGAERSHNPTTV